MRQLSDSCAKSVAKGELRGPSRASSQLEFIEPTQSVNSVRTGHTGQWRRFELAIHSIPAEWFCRKGYYSDNDASASVLESGSCKAPPSRIPVVNRRTDAAERGKRCPLVGYAATNGHSGKPVTDSGADKSVLLAAPGAAGGPLQRPQESRGDRTAAAASSCAASHPQYPARTSQDPPSRINAGCRR